MWLLVFSFFFFKQKTAYEMRISDGSSDVCSADLGAFDVPVARSTVEPVMVAVQRQVEAQPAALGIALFQQTRTMGAFQPAVDSAARSGDAEGEPRRAVAAMPFRLPFPVQRSRLEWSPPPPQHDCLDQAAARHSVGWGERG